jgi:nitrite reductase/ring-hydroxylating ferredoxin subunit
VLARLPSDELVAGEGLESQIRRVRVGDGHVLVARLLSGEVVAFAPVCPHQFTELDEATIHDGKLRCPRHGYSYDARDGENIHPARDTRPENMWKVRPGCLPCFPVIEEDGWISVSDEAAPPPASFDPALEARPGPGRDRDGDQDGDSATPPPGEEVGDVGDGEGLGGIGDREGAPVVVEQSVKFLSVASGSTVEIRLPLVPRPGFAWHYDILGQLLQLVDDQFEPGYSPCQLLRVAAQGVGAATLSCVYANDQGERAEVRTFIVRVQPQG